ncbi:MAG: UTP--glucose-1-phosphate uridylyltransferase [Armatimonadota bacterium]
MSIRKVVIPAAGLGTRLYPATKSQPKEMLPLGRKPCIQLVAEEMIDAGLTEILLITGQQKRALEDHFDTSDGVPPGASGPEDLPGKGGTFFFTRQPRKLGLGDAVGHGRHFTGDEPFAVALGDAVIRGSRRPTLVQRLLTTHQQKGAAATIAVQEVAPERLSRYGVVAPKAEPGDSFDIRDIVEKPRPEEAPSRLAVTARYVFEPAIYEYLDRTEAGYGGEIQLTDAIRMMVRDGLPVWCVRLRDDEERLDIGTFASYARAFVTVMLNDPDVGHELREHLRSVLLSDAPAASEGSGSP